MENTTPFSIVYDSFFSKIVDDMYMEMTEIDTYKILEELLISAIHKFEFPRIDLTDYQTNEIEDIVDYSGVESNYDEVKAFVYNNSGFFNNILTPEEINILSTYMVVE